MKPYNFSHAEQLIGKAVKNKKFEVILLITEVDKSEVTLGNEKYYFNDLLNDFTFLDGSPCGVEEEYNLSFIEVLQTAKEGDTFIGESMQISFTIENGQFVTNLNKKPNLILNKVLLNDKYKKL